MSSKQELLRNYLGFVATRLFGSGVDFAILWICSRYLFTSHAGQYWISPTISFEFAVMSNFLWSYYWIWSDRVGERSVGKFWKSFFVFNVASGMGFMVNILFLNLTEVIFGWDVMWCKAVALLVSGLFNYFFADSVVFRKAKTEFEP